VRAVLHSAGRRETRVCLCWTRRHLQGLFYAELVKEELGLTIGRGRSICSWRSSSLTGVDCMLSEVKELDQNTNLSHLVNI
jgi:hypothetical protein